MNTDSRCIFLVQNISQNFIKPMNAYGTIIVQSTTKRVTCRVKNLGRSMTLRTSRKSGELVKKFKQEHAKGSVKPSGAGTSEIYKPSWVFYGHLKYLTLICDDIDESVNTTDRGPSKPRAKNNKGKLARKENLASKVAAFVNYVHLTLSKFNPPKFRRAKKCIGDILFQLEENDELEATNATPRFNRYGRYSPAPSLLSSYGSNRDANNCSP